MIRLLILAEFFFLLSACMKNDAITSNELPLEDVKGKILYSTGTNLIEMDIQSGVSKTITENRRMARPAWSPDGKLLMWSDSSNSHASGIIKITDVQGNIIFKFDNPDVHDACWSADGKRIALFNIEKKVVTKISLDSFVRDTFKMNVGTLFWEQGNQDWSPDGSKFVFSARDLDPNEFHIWLIDVDGSNLLKLTTFEGWFPRWSPDGQEIAYANLAGITSRHLTTNNSKLLIPNGKAPQWSSDGKLMMYTFQKIGQIAANEGEIRVRSLETGQERIIKSHASVLDWNSNE